MGIQRRIGKTFVCAVCALSLIIGGLHVGAAMQQQATLIAPDGARLDSFGFHIAVSDDGNTIVTGADGHNNATGATYSFTRSGGTWALQQELAPPDAADLPDFGNGIALSGDGTTFAVGAPNGNANAGECYVYTRSGATWIQQARILGTYGANSGFGTVAALSRDGNTLAISAPNMSGAVVAVYTRTGSTWTLQQQLTPMGGTGGSFGSSIALSADGNTLLAGEHDSFHPGAAFLFARNGATWSQQAVLTIAGIVSGDDFGDGAALSADGSVAVVAAVGKNSATGADYVFTRSGATWSAAQMLAASDGVPGDIFGAGIGINVDGTAIAVGARDKSVNGLVRAGAVYRFVRVGGVWQQQQILTRTLPATSDAFGIAVAMNLTGGTLVVGTPGINSVGAMVVFGDVPDAAPGTRPSGVQPVGGGPSAPSGRTGPLPTSNPAPMPTPR